MRRTTLGDVLDVFSERLYLPDPDAVVVVLAAVATNRIPGDGVWLQLVGPPGGGKTETLSSITGLDGVHPVATLTESGLLSASPKKDRGTTSTGGLLRTIGDSGIILCKDFTSVLSMNREARAAVLAALREVYDGSWTRIVGTDGGQTLHWHGRVTLIAGCTQAIDQAHAVMGAMGERFTLYRLRPADAAEQARRSMAHASSGRRMRDDLAGVVCDLFASIDWDATPGEPDADEVERLVALSVFATRCRSAVMRDGYSRDIELIPDAEMPGRLVQQLAHLLRGARMIGADDDRAWRIIRKVALDSIPTLRRDVMALVAQRDRTVSDIVDATGHSPSGARRVLEDLTAHGVITRNRAESTWAATPWLIEWGTKIGMVGPTERRSRNVGRHTFSVFQSKKRHFGNAGPRRTRSAVVSDRRYLKPKEVAERLRRRDVRAVRELMRASGLAVDPFNTGRWLIAEDDLEALMDERRVPAPTSAPDRAHSPRRRASEPPPPYWWREP